MHKFWVKPSIQKKEKLSKNKQHVLAWIINNDWAEYTIISWAGEATSQNGKMFMAKILMKSSTLTKEKKLKRGKRWNLNQFWMPIQIFKEHWMPCFFCKEIKKWWAYKVELIDPKLISMWWAIIEMNGKRKATFKDSDINIRREFFFLICSKMNFKMVAAALKGCRINYLDIQSSYLRAKSQNIFLKQSLTVEKMCIYINEASKYVISVCL